MPPTNSWCYHDNNKVATQTKCIFRHPPTISNCMQNLRGGQNFSFPTLLDSYRELLLKVSSIFLKKLNSKILLLFTRKSFQTFACLVIVHYWIKCQDMVHFCICYLGEFFIVGLLPVLSILEPTAV